MCKCHGSRNKKKAEELAVYPADVLLFTLTGLLWLYIWFGTGLLQGYY